MSDVTRWNEEQREAVTCGEGPVLVLAGPGSGKTFTMVGRISWLLHRCAVPPEKILAVTFTKDAARSMKERFLRKEPAPMAAAVNFSTFHALFYTMLRQSGYRPHGGRTPDETAPGSGLSGSPVLSYRSHSLLLSPYEKKKILLPVLNRIRQETGIREEAGIRKETEAFHRNGGREADPDALPQSCQESADDWGEADGILSAFAYYKNTGNWGKSTEQLTEPWKAQFGRLFAEYEKARAAAGKMDFDDMAYDCLKLLRREDRNFLQRWRGRFSYFCIDEFQDINPVQYQILRLLCEEPYNIFAVGDDDQSIYGFRGSDPGLMRQFLLDYPAARQIELHRNYRSHGEIVQASRRVIEQNRNRFQKRFVAEEGAACANRSAKAGAEPAGIAPVSLCSFPGREEESRYLIRRIQEETRGGNGEDCAVLFRTNLQLQCLAAQLCGAGIPYQVKEKGTCIYDHFIAADVSSYVRLALGEQRRSHWLAVMNKPNRFLSREALAGEEVTLEELKRFYREKPQILHQLEKMETGLSRLRSMKPYLGLQFLRKGMGYETYLTRKAAGEQMKQREWEEVWEWLLKEAALCPNYGAWLERQEIVRRGWKENGDGTGKLQGGVRLMTVHAAKGLEFSKVFLLDVNEGVYPHGGIAQTAAPQPEPPVLWPKPPQPQAAEPQSAEEECRLLYVAMTRAKEALELLFLTGSKERPKLPSRFLHPLLTAHSASGTSSSNSQESRYSSKASDTLSYSSSSSMWFSTGSSPGSSGFSEY